MTQIYELGKFKTVIDPKDGVQLRVRADAYEDMLDVAVFINILLSALLLYSMFFQVYQGLRGSFGQMRHVWYLVIDFISSCLNIAVSVNILNGAGVKVNAPREGHRVHRILFAVVSLLIWLRCLYYM